MVFAENDRHHDKTLYDDLKNIGLNVWMESEDVGAIGIPKG